MSPSLCRQREGDKTSGWAWRGTEFCLRASLGLLTVKVQKQSDVITPHFTCSRSCRPPWPRPRLATAPAGRPAPERSSRLGPPASAPPRLWGASLLAAPSAPGPQTPPSRHPGKFKGPGIQPALRLLRRRRAPTAASRPRDPGPSCACARAGRGRGGGARTDPGRLAGVGCLVPRL